MTPDLVIFDMDGLIFDSERSYMREIQKVMTAYGYDLTEELYKKTVGIRFPDAEKVIQSVFGADFSYAKITKKARPEMLKLAAAGKLTVKPGIRELIKKLHAAGIPLTVASSSADETVRIYLEGAGLSEYFTFIIGGDHVVHGKPDPEVFLTCCERAGVAPSRAVVLEDSTNGIKAGLAAGIPVICIPDMIYPDEQLRGQLYALCEDGFAAAELFSF